MITTNTNTNPITTKITIDDRKKIKLEYPDWIWNLGDIIGKHIVEYKVGMTASGRIENTGYDQLMLKSNFYMYKIQAMHWMIEHGEIMVVLNWYPHETKDEDHKFTLDMAYIDFIIPKTPSTNYLSYTTKIEGKSIVNETEYVFEVKGQHTHITHKDPLTNKPIEQIYDTKGQLIFQHLINNYKRTGEMMDSLVIEQLTLINKQSNSIALDLPASKVFAVIDKRRQSTDGDFNKHNYWTSRIFVLSNFDKDATNTPVQFFGDIGGINETIQQKFLQLYSLVDNLAKYHNLFREYNHKGTNKTNIEVVGQNQLSSGSIQNAVTLYRYGFVCFFGKIRAVEGMSEQNAEAITFRYDPFEEAKIKTLQANIKKVEADANLIEGQVALNGIKYQKIRLENIRIALELAKEFKLTNKQLLEYGISGELQKQSS